MSTPLSPVTKAVMDAVNHYETNHWLTSNQVAAAVLRVVATQVTPLSTNLRQNKIRYELLAIANELEGFDA
jgi:hypothetical protein